VVTLVNERQKKVVVRRKFYRAFFSSFLNISFGCCHRRRLFTSFYY
jgi:hypothetical protein